MKEPSDCILHLSDFASNWQQYRLFLFCWFHSFLVVFMVLFYVASERWMWEVVKLSSRVLQRVIARTTHVPLVWDVIKLYPIVCYGRILAFFIIVVVNLVIFLCIFLKQGSYNILYTKLISWSFFIFTKLITSWNL